MKKRHNRCSNWKASEISRDNTDSFKIIKTLKETDTLESESKLEVSKSLYSVNTKATSSSDQSIFITEGDFYK